MKKSLSIFISCILLIFCFSMQVFGFETSYENEEGKTVKINDFLDTQGHWAHDTILRCADFEWISGYNGNFMPNDYVKRGDLALIIDRMLGLKTVSYNFFTDLSNNAYYRESLLRCVAAGYISGTGTNTVNPNGYATREQVATIICRIFNIDVSYTGNTGFIDDSQISSWAKPSIYAMKRLGYMNGNGGGLVNPTMNITRAELITLLNNVANTYIPKRDSSGQGTSFRNQFPTNVVTSRNVELVNSEVGRDLILTQSANTVDLRNTIIKGRLLILAKSTVNLSNSKISQIVLMDGKTSITGMGDGVEEVYISSFASESTLDAIPNRVVLESGVRVKIGNTMYENTSTSKKILTGSELKSTISEEQGFIIGGPKVTGVTFSQDTDNTITVSNVKITVGDSAIKEVGVIWLDQDEDEDTVVPTYKNNDGKKIYNSDKYEEPFSFEGGTVKGIRAYRLYVLDRDGLLAYSDSKVFSSYDYDISLKVYGNDYPDKVDVELIIKGDSIPPISSVRVVYDVTELYSESHNIASMRLYTDANAEVQPDSNKYRRYITTINAFNIRNESTNVVEKIPPTAFGYIINFANGTLINRFPVLNNSLPSDISPVTQIETGNASYSGLKTIKVSNNKITTKYAIPQEVGVVYKVSTQESMSKPNSNANGWEKQKANVNLGLNDSIDFDVNIPKNSEEGYTYYSVYVKMSNGYWYGDVKRILNATQGDENGPVLAGSPEVVVLNDTSAVVKLLVNNISENVNTFEEFIKSVSVNNNSNAYLLGKSLTDLNVYIQNIENVPNSKYIIFNLTNLTPNSEYAIVCQLTTQSGLKSNLISVNVNTNSFISLSLGDRTNDSNGWVSYQLFFGVDNCKISSSNHYFSKGSGQVVGQAGIDNSYLKVADVVDFVNTQVVIYCRYIIDSFGTDYIFTRVVDLK